MNDIMLASCPFCGKEIKVNKTKKNGFCLHCGQELDVASVINTSGRVDVEYLDALLKESDTAFKAENFERCIGLVNSVILEDEDNVDAWHKKALALVHLGYQERLELKKPEDADFSKKLAAAQGNMASVMALINSKNECWKEKSHRAFRNRVKEAVECENHVQELMSIAKRKDSYDELAYCIFEVMSSQPDQIAWPQTGDIIHLVDFKKVSNNMMLKILNTIISRVDSGAAVNIYQYILEQIKANAKGLDIKLESKLLNYESKLVNQGDYSFFSQSDNFDENAIIPIQPITIDAVSSNQVSGYTKEQIDIAYYKKQIELKEEELEMQRQQIMSQARCPKCGSTSLAVDKKGFGYGKAAVGTVLIGPVGLLAGGIGANKQMCTCMNCKHSFKL